VAAHFRAPYRCLSNDLVDRHSHAQDVQQDVQDVPYLRIGGAGLFDMRPRFILTVVVLTASDPSLTTDIP
jgi:hypothetical protein